MAPKFLRSRIRGFTAVEIMVVVAIAAILAAAAAPNMINMVRNQRVKTAAFDVFASLTFARGEAVKRNSTVTITPTNAADWTQGWTITDANGVTLKAEGNRNVTSEQLVMTGPALPIAFARSGRLAGAAPQFTVTTPSGAYAYKRCITVDLSGRPVSKTEGDPTC